MDLHRSLADVVDRVQRPQENNMVGVWPWDLNPPANRPRLTMIDSMELEVASLMVETLNLPDDPANIDPEAPLFNSGLGLDSIDALELAMVISQKYGIQLRSDDSDNTKIFASLRALTAHIADIRRA